MRKSVFSVALLIAIGLMIPWTDPVMREGPSVKSDSHALSFTISSVCMFSRMYTPLIGSKI